jgi:hypothetical protein
MRVSLPLLLVSAALNLSGTIHAQDYGDPYRFYREPGSFAAPRTADYGNPYRYYRSPSYYDSTRPDVFDYNENRRETLQYLYRHQLIAPKSVVPGPTSELLPRYRPYRSYYYSSPYLYYRGPSSYGTTSRSYSDRSLRYLGR